MKTERELWDAHFKSHTNISNVCKRMGENIQQTTAEQTEAWCHAAMSQKILKIQNYQQLFVIGTFKHLNLVLL